jgi:hypothetical protein
MAVINWGMHYHQQRKTPKYCLKVSSGDFEYGTTVGIWSRKCTNMASGAESYPRRGKAQVCKEETRMSCSCVVWVVVYVRQVRGAGCRTSGTKLPGM